MIYVSDFFPLFFALTVSFVLRESRVKNQIKQINVATSDRLSFTLHKCINKIHQKNKTTESFFLLAHNAYIPRRIEVININRNANSRPIWCDLYHLLFIACPKHCVLNRWARKKYRCPIWNCGAMGKQSKCNLCIARSNGSIRTVQNGDVIPAFSIYWKLYRIRCLSVDVCCWIFVFYLLCRSLLMRAKNFPSVCATSSNTYVRLNTAFPHLTRWKNNTRKQ